MKNYHLLGYASGLAGVDLHTGEGPLALQQSPYLSMLTNQGLHFYWDAMIRGTDVPGSLRVDEVVRMLCIKLAEKTAACIRHKQHFSVIGGDHTCAIGTWSGAYDALHEQGDIGLIWLDAHMDSHTPETSESGHIHGMPLASLLGYGYSTLTTILHAAPKVKPENVCLIGVRSFERGEAELLQRLKVRIYFMDEVKQRGFATVWHEAIKQVQHHTIAYGISVDIDGLDPHDAPAVDVPEPDGIAIKSLRWGLSEVVTDSKLIATEFVEFDPLRDRQHKTEKLLVSLLKIMATGK